MGLLSGQVAVITGASKGIGRVMSQHFAMEGAKVVCAARSSDLVKETAWLIEQAGGQAVALTCDASLEASVRTMVEAAVDAYGRIDALVNNAGDSGPTRAVQDYSTADWYDTIDSCLTSSYMCIRFVTPEIIRVGGGSIVNISSVAGRRGLPYRIGYCAAKAGQLGMVSGLALELAPYRITVNAIAPAAVAGDRVERVIAREAQVRGMSLEQARKSWIERAPLKRMIEPDEIATLAAFLCSAKARTISGQCISVTAGEAM